MRIAFDEQIFCQQSYGGVSRYFVRLAEQLVVLNQNIGIFAPLHRNRYTKELPPGVLHGYGVNRYPPKCGQLIMKLNQLGSRWSLSKWQPQLVHETYYSAKSSTPKNCPRVITVYDMIHELYKDKFGTHDRTTACKKLAVERADHVICISESTRRDLIDIFAIREEKISVVHLGFDRLAEKTPFHDVKSSTEKPFLFYVGNRGGYKNFDGFIRAVASSNRLKKDFDIQAFGGGAFTKSELTKIESIGFQPGQVRQISGGDDVLGDLYYRATALVYPSLYEGFGLPPLEAMAHQCAVVSSNTSSMPEVVGDAGEYFDPTLTEEMAIAIENVVYSADRNQELISRGQERLEHFEWEKCAKRTLKIYHSLVL